MSGPTSRAFVRATLLAALIAPAARAQFQFFTVNGNTETKVPVVDPLGNVIAGDATSFPFRLRNVTSSSQMLSLLEVKGVGFSVTSAPALPLTLPAHGTVDFTVTFRVSDSDQLTGTTSFSAALMTQGDSVLLTISVHAGIPPPAPKLNIDLPRTQSLQQGSATITFDAPAQRSGSGALTLQFRPSVTGASDAAIAFDTGGRTTTFTFASGDTTATFGGKPSVFFQTGTTAGALILTAQLGTASDQHTITIAPAAVGVSTATASRSAGGIEVQVTGFDNTRTVGQLGFTFFDTTAKPIAQGIIQTDASATFSRFFQSSDAGGTFLLRAVFPVTGDALQIGSFEATLTNAEGAAVTSRTRF